MKNPEALFLVILPISYFIWQLFETLKAAEQFYTYSHLPGKERKISGFMTRRYMSVGLNTGAMMFIIIALSHPFSVSEGGGVSDDIKSDFVLVFDISNSMNGDDNGESRLEKSKSSARNLVYTEGEGRFSLVIFKGKSYILLPLTSDKNLIVNSINSLSSDMLTSSGTDIQSGIIRSLDIFPENEKREKKIIVYTDGEDSFPGGLEITGRRTAEKVLADNIKIVIVMPDSDEGSAVGEGEEQHISIPDYSRMEKAARLWGGAVGRFSDFNKSGAGLMQRRIRDENDYSLYYVFFSVLFLFGSIFIRRSKL